MKKKLLAIALGTSVVFALGACGNKEESKPSKQSASTDSPEQIYQKSCIGCHAVGSNDSRPPSARIAPNLANFADRDTVAGIAENNEENLKKWLKDPENMKPGNKMTGKYGNLTDDQIDALNAYLQTLKVEK